MSPSFRHPAARYFEEFEIGDKIVTQGRTITEADIVSFAGVSGDFNPLHLDAEYTRDGMFGGRIAHGLLVLSAASGLAWQLGFMAGTVEAFLSLEWKFRAPVKIGDTIHVEAEVAQRKAIHGTPPTPQGGVGQGVSSSGGGIVTFNVVVKNQRDEMVQKGQWTVMVKSKPAE